MSKKRIILHIGTHKTGSTTVQNALYERRSDLVGQGFFYPSSSLDTENNHKKHQLFRKALLGDDVAFSDCWARVQAEWEESAADVMILSEEDFGFLAFYNPRAAKRFQQIASSFEMQAICYLRRPDTFVESHWNQKCKSGQTKYHIGKYLNQESTANYLRYVEILDLWASFADIRVTGFEAAREVGMIASFSGLTGLHLEAEDVKRNVSPSMTCAAAVAALSRSTGKLYNWRKIEPRLGEEKRWTALGRIRRQRLLDGFSEQRGVLERQYGVVFPDTMPDEPDEMIERPDPEDVAQFARPEFL